MERGAQTRAGLLAGIKCTLLGSKTSCFGEDFFFQVSQYGQAGREEVQPYLEKRLPHEVLTFAFSYFLYMETFCKRAGTRRVDLGIVST